ncbi:hypothetical protein E2P81_ATG01680 [Venturia nashicola]|nr:hypothetical protein E2P81_ATG01680 [Venturia nashicola]
MLESEGQNSPKANPLWVTTVHILVADSIDGRSAQTAAIEPPQILLRRNGQIQDGPRSQGASASSPTPIVSRSRPVLSQTC